MKQEHIRSKQISRVLVSEKVHRNEQLNINIESRELRGLNFKTRRDSTPASDFADDTSSPTRRVQLVKMYFRVLRNTTAQRNIALTGLSITLHSRRPVEIRAETSIPISIFLTSSKLFHAFFHAASPFTRDPNSFETNYASFAALFRRNCRV